MKIVKPSHEILLPESPLKHIEKIGRICYKSEDAITDISAEGFVGRLFKSGHHAMLEHFRFIVEIDRYCYYALDRCKNKYITLTEDNDRYIMSASARGINDAFMSLYQSINHSDFNTAGHLADIANFIVDHYGCTVMFDIKIMIDWAPDDRSNYPHCIRIIEDFNELSDYEYQMHAWYSILFTCDRGVTHEMVRHRDASFAQESTRYCNYSKGKYGNEITVIDPFFFDKDEERKMVNGCDFPVNKYDIWNTCIKNIEKAYMMLMELGAVPQQARSILVNSTKADIVITAQVYEWNHIFDLRVLGKTGAPHPQIKEVMEPAFIEMNDKKYLR